MSFIVYPLYSHQKCGRIFAHVMAGTLTN